MDSSVQSALRTLLWDRLHFTEESRTEPIAIGWRQMLRRIIATSIKYWRSRRQLSQEALADLAELHRNYVGAVQRFEKNISADNIEKLANALQIEPKELMRKRLKELPPNLVGYRLGNKRNTKRKRRRKIQS